YIYSIHARNCGRKCRPHSIKNRPGRIGSSSGRRTSASRFSRSSEAASRSLRASRCAVLERNETAVFRCPNARCSHWQPICPPGLCPVNINVTERKLFDFAVRFFSLHLPRQNPAAFGFIPACKTFHTFLSSKKKSPLKAEWSGFFRQFDRRIGSWYSGNSLE